MRWERRHVCGCAARGSILADGRPARAADDRGRRPVPAVRHLPGRLAFLCYNADGGICRVRRGAARNVPDRGTALRSCWPPPRHYRGAPARGGRDGLLRRCRLSPASVPGPDHSGPGYRRCHRGSQRLAGRPPARGPAAARLAGEQRCADHRAGRGSTGSQLPCAVRARAAAPRLLAAGGRIRGRHRVRRSAERAGAAPAGCARVAAPAGRRPPAGVARIRRRHARPDRGLGARRAVPGTRTVDRGSAAALGRRGAGRAGDLPALRCRRCHLGAAPRYRSEDAR